MNNSNDIGCFIKDYPNSQIEDEGCTCIDCIGEKELAENKLLGGI